MHGGGVLCAVANRAGESVKASEYAVWLIFGGMLALAIVIGQVDRKLSAIHSFLVNAQRINVVSTNSVEVTE